MTEDELAEIEERTEKVYMEDWWHSDNFSMLLENDIPALIAEVRQLQKEVG